MKRLVIVWIILLISLFVVACSDTKEDIKDVEAEIPQTVQESVVETTEETSKEKTVDESLTDKIELVLPSIDTIEVESGKKQEDKTEEETAISEDVTEINVELESQSETAVIIPEETVYIPEDDNDMGCINDGLTW